mmetsp:Transcript_149229/g.477978  ORF Transcript_149229/g.477978 Transcript_149229/m.477978 type:complete len:225 (-) Transcript_149229:78-752(-)
MEYTRGRSATSCLHGLQLQDEFWIDLRGFWNNEFSRLQAVWEREDAIFATETRLVQRPAVRSLNVKELSTHDAAEQHALGAALALRIGQHLFEALCEVGTLAVAQAARGPGAVLGNPEALVRDGLCNLGCGAMPEQMLIEIFVQRVTADALLQRLPLEMLESEDGIDGLHTLQGVRRYAGDVSKALAKARPERQVPFPQLRALDAPGSSHLPARALHTGVDKPL